MKLSGIVIAKNEGNLIRGALDSLKFCDEVILIDNESNDRETIEFIKNSADKYFRFNKRVSVAHA